MKTTIFTKIINNEIPSKKIFENKDFIAILDITPKNPGHTLLIPKLQSNNIIIDSKKTKKNILEVASNISDLLTKKLDATGIKMIFNSGASAGQEIFHTHLHIIPYYDKEVNYSIDEVYKKIIK